jgi:hypothetical protein
MSWGTSNVRANLSQNKLKTMSSPPKMEKMALFVVKELFHQAHSAQDSALLVNCANFSLFSSFDVKTKRQQVHQLRIHP